MIDIKKDEFLNYKFGDSYINLSVYRDKQMINVSHGNSQDHDQVSLSFKTDEDLELHYHDLKKHAEENRFSWLYNNFFVFPMGTPLGDSVNINVDLDFMGCQYVRTPKFIHNGNVYENKWYYLPSCYVLYSTDEDNKDMVREIISDNQEFILNLVKKINFNYIYELQVHLIDITKNTSAVKIKVRGTSIK